MNPPSFHTRIRKVGALVTATLILPALAFVVVSLSFSAQAAEKKKIMGTNKWGPVISRTVVPLGPGDDPKHELVVLAIYRATTTSSDPDFNETEIIAYEQDDEVAGTGTHRGYFIRLHKNGDTDYGTYEGTHKTTFKEDGSWETRRGRGPGRRLEEPASLRISKAVARIGGRPRQKGPLTSGKVKRNTNVRPGGSFSSGTSSRTTTGCGPSPCVCTELANPELREGWLRRDVVRAASKGNTLTADDD